MTTGQKCWEPTQRLLDLRERDPETADAIERVVYGALAARGLLMMYAPDADKYKTLEAINRSVQPFAELRDPFDAAMAARGKSEAHREAARRAGKASGLARKAAEINKGVAL
jgi:hypothetical protein